MTSSNRHRIQRQIVELSFGGGIAASAIQKSFARSFNEEIIPDIEAVFDRTASAHELLRLEHLEIDLGRIENSDWQPELRRRLGVELARKLALYTPETTSGPESGPGSSTRAAAADPLRLFLHFLSRGRIPWWGVRPEAGWSEYLPVESLDAPAVRAALRTEAPARIRFVDAFDDDRLDAIIVRWCALPSAARVLNALSRGVPGTAIAAWRRAFWRKLLELALEPGALPARGAALLRELLELRARSLASPVGLKSPTPKGNAGHATVESRTAVDAPGGLPPPWREWLPEASAAPPAQLHSGAGAAPVPAKDPLVSLADDRAKSSRAAPWPADEEAIYLPGAGAVLLHPFLEPLFRARGLLEGRSFRDAEARERAVHLIGLLTYDRCEVAEYDLVTAKLLCGHPIGEPLTPASLDDMDAAAGDELLAAVLKHWTALRSRSADWLRTQFFLRDGKLEPVDEGFRLTVERRAQDVLLARLPWGIGVIGFPWMKERVFVRWLD